MKTLKLILLSAGIFVSMSLSFSVQAQNKQEKQQAEAAALKKLTESRKLKFVPQTIQTQGSQRVELPLDFFIELEGDSINVYLPYNNITMKQVPAFTYSPYIRRFRGPLDFVTSKFSYEVEFGKKGDAFIRIRLDNSLQARQLFMDVSVDGYTTVSARFGTLQSITFYGQTKSFEGPLTF